MGINSKYLANIDAEKKDKLKIAVLSAVLLIGISLFLFYGLNENNYHYNLNKRIPRLAAILVVGGSISFGAVIFQTIINNRIITPSILGMGSMYGFVQSFIVYVFGVSSIFIVNVKVNFLISTVFMLLMSFALFKFVFKEAGSIFYLLLVGTVLGTLLTSLKTFMEVLIDPNDYTVLESKLFASFSNINTDILLLTIVIIVFIGIFIFDDVQKLDVMLLGRENAINLGVDFDKLSKKFLFIIAILVAISTALAGPVTFLSIMVVNLSYHYINSYKHKYVIASSMLMGCIALVFGQFFVERILNYNTKISIIINFVGGVYFLYLLLKESRHDRN